jgi:fatty acid amide hydrolase
MDTVIGLSATEIAEAIAKGEVSITEVVEAHIKRIETVNTSLNAVVIPLFEQARAEAKVAETTRHTATLPLYGVPITIKECFDLVGTPSTLGLTELVNTKATQNAVMVERLKQAGAIILGKTNVPQMGTMNETDNPVYGRTNNPWNLERAPGGSSGGEAAIIAAGGSPLGLGSDIGGSVRLPAHACGIHGFKPTSRRLTNIGHFPFCPGQEGIILQPGVMARSVNDLKLAMKILATPVKEIDPSIPPVGWSEVNIEIEKLRIAFYTDNGVITPSPAVRRAVKEAAEALENRGAVVEEWKPNLAKSVQLYTQILSADGFATFKRQIGKGKWHPRIKKYYQTASTPKKLLNTIAAIADLTGLHDMAHSLGAIGELSVTDYWQIIDEKNRYCAEFLATMNAQKYDAIICPPCALPALKHGSGFFLSEDTTYTSLYNLLGMPAGVVAATKVRAGEESDRLPSKSLIERTASFVEQGSTDLPIGVQVAAHHWREDIVFAVMLALEEHFQSQPDYPQKCVVAL